MSDDGKRDLSRLTPELRAALVSELTRLIERAAALTPDEVVVLLHLLAYAGFSGDGVLVVPELSALWGAADSYIPAAHLPPDRARAAVEILRRRGVLKDAEHGAALVDNAVLRALADAPR
ncbi:MAG: hypothetical protein COV48_10990 [Elusimicrobia bacterium CG11_big_fil_rev_8_21_14_0_20_64_6]|nr:MAG: hypothetical protein COV48_10990 [Elusimicrobia bacterium CG11_big_fil_rev_8_21_14_0_20_64_6]